jgi:hypothetical protein
MTVNNRSYSVTVTWEGDLMARDYGIGTYRVIARSVEDAIARVKQRMRERRKRSVEIIKVV